ncbi:hypothetical protein HPB52_023655 [Rhipicephalus sanguineus]|uniref:CCHC-type domain-containing protein n=1 Tax=Rhipicephalus sanguineus TaxID=34632 RepID=A0A9D4T4M7_RHISA|nr:hypothetical protein HPB52_023655 [Rhipicephalus sanguineus]
MPRKPSGKTMKLTGKAQRVLQQQEELPERQAVTATGDRPQEKAKEALPPSQVTSEPPATTAALPEPARNTAAPAAPSAAVATAPAAPRDSAMPQQRSRSGTRVRREPFHPYSDSSIRYSTVQGRKQDEEDYKNFETWLAHNRATQRAAANAAHATTSTSTAQAPTASPNQLERQAVTTIGDWLLNKAKEAAPAAPDLPEQAATTSASTDDSSSSPHFATSDDEAMDATATSRKRAREEHTTEYPRKLASTQATTAAAPAASPSVVAAPPAAPALRRKKNKRKARPKRRLPAREYETSAAEALTPPRPLNTTVAVPRPCPSPPPAEDDFVTVVSKAAQRRARALEAAAVAIDPAVVGTALFRPSAPGGSFSGSPRLKLAAALAKRPGVLAVRVNHRRNIVAADASTPTCLSELLAIRELGGVPLTAREPADRRFSTGFVYGVDGDLTDTELLAGITSACQQCGRFGHMSETCQRTGACIRCGRQHLEAESCKPRCVNCGGAHAADTPTCPRWQEEKRVATLMASLQRRPREGRSRPQYARSPVRSSLPAAPSAAPAEDPRDALNTNLLATLQAVTQFLPEEHPLRATCLQANGARPGAPRSE